MREREFCGKARRQAEKKEIIFWGVGESLGGVAPRSGGGKEGAADLIEVGEGEEQVEPGGVFGQATETHGSVTPEAFDDPEGKLDLGAQAGFLPVAMTLT